MQRQRHWVLLVLLYSGVAVLMLLLPMLVVAMRTSCTCMRSRPDSRWAVPDDAATAEEGGAVGRPPLC
jgi:Na+-transporting methylmalonyl-CoA/oxaloacetate decarboxylase gamma subunit